jgi:hypothetical protein
MPDHLPAMQFIDDFTDAVAYYGEDATRQVLRRCCASPIARTWLTSLDDVDRQALQCSTWDWERLIRRDFMPPKDIMEGIATAEKYNWTQDRTPAEYFTYKLVLLRIAGIADHDQVVPELHRGFATAPQIHAPLNQYVKKSGNHLSEYLCAVQNYQDAAGLLYEYNVRADRQPRQRADGVCGMTTPKASECRRCFQAFPSRSRLHEHLRVTGHNETERNTRQPEIIESTLTTTKAINERFREIVMGEQRAFMGINVQSTVACREPEKTTSSHSNCRQPRHAFFGIAIASNTAKTPAASAIPLQPEEAASSQDSSPIDEAGTPELFSIKTGYEGVTFKERGYPRSPVSYRASLRSSFTTVPAAFPLPLRLCSSILRETSAAQRQHLKKVKRKLIY